MSLIIDTIQQHLPPKRKTTPSGWVSFNAVCCHHNGTSADSRQRGGIMINEGVSYHCFNCGFKASWQPGRNVSIKVKKLMKWLNVSDTEINKCMLDALRHKEGIEDTGIKSSIPTFVNKALPLGAEPIASYLDEIPNELIPVLEYLASRKLYLEDYNFYWTPEEGFQNRLIIPFYYQNQIVGYTARKITNGKPKYISEQQPGYVFNLDSQTSDKKFVIAVEGPIDAICIGGIALTSAEIGASQQALISRLQREIIVLPDRDQAGIKLVDQALKLGWSVSFPEWGEDVKDVNDAVKKYGRIYTLWSIVTSKESNNLKIQLKAKKWFKEEHETNN